MYGLHLFLALAVVSVINQRESVVVEAVCLEMYVLKTAICFDMKSVPVFIFPDLRYLYLDGNLITAIGSVDFWFYPELETLQLSHNNISRIDKGAFEPLQKLTRLDLNHCSLNSFSGDIIKPLPPDVRLNLSENKLQSINWASTNSLYSVDLSRNRFRQISSETFVFNHYVKLLDLSENPLTVIEASPMASLHVESINLDQTHLANSQWSNLFRGIGLSPVSELSLKRADIHDVKPGFFSPLKGKNLTELDMRMNSFGAGVIQNNTFSDLTGVSRLVVSSNDFQAVEPILFNGMASLRSLLLDENQITTINSQAGTWNLSITKLNLADNALRVIKNYAFQGLTTLQTLDLSKNSKLQVIGNETFTNLPFITKLDLSSTDITGPFSSHLRSLLTLIYRDGTSIPYRFIEPGNLGKETPSLLELVLANNELYDLFFYDEGISSFSGLHDLLRLDLSENLLFRLSVGVFDNLTNLQILNLEQCSVEWLETAIFRDLDNLLELNLEHNSMIALSPGLFEHMKNLQRLKLKGNRLTYLDSDLFKHCTSLEDLDISHNLIASLNRSTFKPLERLSYFSIAFNPLVCNCDLKWFPGWLAGSVEIKFYLDDPICLDGPGTLKPFRGKKLIYFDPGEDCDPNIVLYSCLALVGVTLILTLGLIYYQRWWIRYRLFLLKICFIGYDEIHDDVERREFQYDLAIMHHEADNEWVNENMRPALAERVPDFDRIVCGDEELMLGMYYLDAVHYATEQSFKTIVVVSREALQDQWFIMKFRTVLDHVNDEVIEKMILVFVEDIPGDELPFLIRLFLSDHRPYLVWPDDERGQDYFWEELIKDLTVNIRCNHLVPP